MITEPTFCASVVCMDPLNIERDTQELYDMGHRYLHMDIMDGHYVPRYGIYPEISRFLSDRFPDMKQDCHLMVEDAEFAIDQFADIDAITTFTFHIDDNEKNAARIIDKIRGQGKQAGIALNLMSPLATTANCINHLDLDFVCFMGIHPGVLKQTSKPEVLYKKIPELLNRIDKPITVQIDGGVGWDTIPHLIEAGANFFVGGTSTIYKTDDSVYNNSMKIKELMHV